MVRLVGTISRLLAGRVARQVLVGLAVIEGIFLAESLTGILERVLRHGGSGFDVLGVLALTSPEIFDFALPLAILVGVYFSLNASREDGEFIVCSAAGIPWLRIPGFVAVVGAAGFALCILVSGYVSPLAATLKRAVIYELQVRQIRQQISDSSPRDTIETYGGRTFIATSEVVGGRRRGQLFVHHPVEDGQFRVTQTRDWGVAGPDPQGSFVITFNSVLDYVFPLDAGQTADGE
ncbi:MAG: LptF/LptG family permease, partial [Rhizobiaceae bacterium]